jgi:hypothetical protein
MTLTERSLADKGHANEKELAMVGEMTIRRTFKPS